VFASEKMYPAWEVFFFEKSFGCYLAVAWDIKKERCFLGESPKNTSLFLYPMPPLREAQYFTEQEFSATSLSCHH